MRVERPLIGLGMALVLATQPVVGGDLRDLYFGEAVYHALQGRYFDALQRLDTELAMHHGLDQPELDTLHYHINDAEFSVGDFELNYRMHHRADQGRCRVPAGKHRYGDRPTGRRSQGTPAGAQR